MERDWRELFVVGPSQQERDEVHLPGECNMNCQMARELVCVCRCGGKNHGALLKKDLKRLDEFNGEDQTGVP